MTSADQPRSFAYLNIAAEGYPKSQTALTAFDHAIRRPPAGSRSGVNGSVFESYRAEAARLFGAKSTEVFFVPSATIALNMAVRGLVPPRGRCLVDNRSHNSVLRPIANGPFESRTVTLYGLDEEPNLSELRSACADFRPDVVCLTHVSNVTGSVYSLEDVIAVVRESSSAFVVIDAAQSVGAVPLKTLPYGDVIVFPAHKHLHSVPGAAVLISRVELRPTLFGGTGSESSRLRIDERWWKWIEVGAPNEPAVAAMMASLKEQASTEDRVGAPGAELTGYLWEALKMVPGLCPIGRPPGSQRIGTIACRVQFGHTELEWARLMASAGVIARGGLHCSPDVHTQLGLEQVGTLRFSLGRYTTIDEIDYAMSVVCDVAGALKE